MKLRLLPLLLGVSALAAEPFIPSVPDKQPEPPFPPTPPEAGITMLVPGFTVRELPVKLTNLNNLEYAPDGRLFAGGYDGRFHVLRDTNGDGLEDKVDTFAPATNENYPLGMAVKEGALYTVLTDLKKFTARRLLEQLQREGRDWLMRLHAEGRAAHKTGSRYQVWQEGFHPQAILDDAMLLQKLEYLHNNPVRRGWVASPEHWRWSSAHA